MIILRKDRFREANNVSLIRLERSLCVFIEYRLAAAGTPPLRPSGVAL
jgi:hypothetical protein